jgi:hypothetical protein
LVLTVERLYGTPTPWPVRRYSWDYDGLEPIPCGTVALLIEYVDHERGDGRPVARLLLTDGRTLWVVADRETFASSIKEV